MLIINYKIHFIIKKNEYSFSLHFPLPRIDQVFEAMKGAKIMSAFCNSPSSSIKWYDRK